KLRLWPSLCRRNRSALSLPRAEPATDELDVHDAASTARVCDFLRLGDRALEEFSLCSGTVSISAISTGSSRAAGLGTPITALEAPGSSRARGGIEPGGSISE